MSKEKTKKATQKATNGKQAAKKAMQSPKKAMQSPKKAMQSPKKATQKGQKKAQEPSKGPALASNGGAKAPKGSADKVPAFAPVALVAPRRTGRTLRDPEAALGEAESRLRLAWGMRSELEPRLPGKDDFHAVAWTALAEVRRLRKAMGLQAPPASREQALAALVSRLGLVRGIVADTTRPGDPLRTKLRFDVPLQPNAALVDAADEILDGAREVQPHFPALGDDVIEAAEGALEHARQAMGQSREQQQSRRLARATSGDRLQLAIDVLLDGIDHLRAAARAAFLPDRPAAAEPFLGALEPQSHGDQPEDEAQGEDQAPAPHEAPT